MEHLETTAITTEMIEAGIEAAEFEGYEWGWGQEEELVTRVYLAMAKAALRHEGPTPLETLPETHS